MDWNIYLWAGAAVVFALIEACTTALCALWFVVGAVAALVSTLLGANLTIQVLVFVITSALSLLLFYPFVKKTLIKKTVPTNADTVIGKVGIVKERIDNVLATGTVNVDGKMWTARTANGDIAEVGDKVIVRKIDGVKLIVSKQQ